MAKGKKKTKPGTPKDTMPEVDKALTKAEGKLEALKKAMAEADKAVTNLPEGIHVDDDGCECMYCKYGAETMNQMELDMIERYGWFAHYVQDDPDMPLNVNYHTHGLVESFNHPDIQIVMPLQPVVAHELFNAIVVNIKEGVRYKGDGTLYAEIFEGKYKARFVEKEETGRTVLRLIVPDVNGEYKIHPYDKQEL